MDPLRWPGHQPGRTGDGYKGQSLDAGHERLERQTTPAPPPPPLPLCRAAATVAAVVAAYCRFKAHHVSKSRRKKMGFVRSAAQIPRQAGAVTVPHAAGENGETTILRCGGLSLLVIYGHVVFARCVRCGLHNEEVI